MRPEDVPAPSGSAPRASTSSTSAMLRRSRPGPSSAPTRARAGWIERTLHLLRTDPGGCWVAEDDGGLVGMATSFRRETLWCLATYAVLPGPAGPGHRQAAARRRAAPRPRLPARHALGVVGPEGGAPLPAGRVLAAPADVPDRAPSTGPRSRSSRRCATGRAGDFDLMDSLDRPARGAAHGPDHELMLRHVAAAGVRHHRPGPATPTSTSAGSSALLAATNRRTAARLLWAAPGRRRRAGHVAARHGGERVGARRRARGPARPRTRRGTSALRGMKPPAPYLHHGSLL